MDTILGTSAVIRWQKLLTGGVDEVVIAGYQVWYAKESNPSSANFVNATKNDTLVPDNLTRNTRYMVKVRAISALGFGLWSSTVNFRTARTGRYLLIMLRVKQSQDIIIEQGAHQYTSY